jgi:addiction module HigA family antidote
LTTTNHLAAIGAATKEGHMAKKLAPLHPGEVLREEFLVPLNMSAGALAKACGVPRTRIERLMNEQIGITADTALRLSRAFRTTPELWLNLQNSFDVQTARLKIARELAQIEPVNKAA